MITNRVVLVGKIPSTTWRISSQDDVRPFGRGTRKQPYLRGRKLTKVILITYIHWADPSSRV